MATRDELLARAQKPAEEAMRLHAFYRGKIQTAPKCPFRSSDDFAVWYTPGAAALCRAIAARPAAVWELTNRAKTVAVVSDGTRVLGLGDIGPEAGRCQRVANGTGFDRCEPVRTGFNRREAGNENGGQLPDVPEKCPPFRRAPSMIRTCDLLIRSQPL